MTFLKLSNGLMPTGNEAASFTSSFLHVPDNTQANAMIKSFEPKEFDGEKSYQIVWELMNGDYRGTFVKQSITPFAQDSKKSDRAKEMFFRLYNLCQVELKHDNPPTKEDLSPFIGTKCSIKVGNGHIQHVERTWVREIHPIDKLEVVTGHTSPVVSSTTIMDSALSRNPRVVQKDLLDDVPF